MLAWSRSSQLTVGASSAFVNLSAALTELGQLDEALSTARECVPLMTRNGHLWFCLDSFGLPAFKRDRFKAAAITLGCSDAMCAEKGRSRDTNDARARALTLAGLQKAFSKTELKRLLAEGAALIPEEAGRIALAD